MIGKKQTIIVNQTYSTLVPKMSEAEYTNLKQSIKEQGLLVAIVVNQHGTVLDGHHRLTACTELGIEPNIITKEFASPLEEQRYVIETNLQRRELNQFQRAELALKLRPIAQEIAKKNMSEGGKGSRILEPFHTDKELAKTARVSTYNLRLTERVLKSGNQDLILDARSGRRTVHNAAEKGHLLTQEENIARSKKQHEEIENENNEGRAASSSSDDPMVLEASIPDEKIDSYRKSRPVQDERAKVTKIWLIVDRTTEQVMRIEVGDPIDGGTQGDQEVLF